MKIGPWFIRICFLAAGFQALCLQAATNTSEIHAGQQACVFGCNAQSPAAASPYYAFEKTAAGMPDAASRRWHAEHEENPDYGESWFFLVHTRQGGVLFAIISITNLGLRTFDSAFDVRFYAPGGEVYKLCTDFRRKDISAAGNGLDLTIGGHRLKGNENTYQLRINDARLQLDLTLKRSLPAFQFGDGRVVFYADRSAEWGIGFDVPRAIASGSLTAEGKMFNLAGNGYHDHTWSTIKLPAFMEKWHTLRFYQGRFAIILHQMHLTQKFGGGLLCAGLIGDGDDLIPIRSFLYKPLKWRVEPTSGLAIPTELQLCIRADSYSITGTIKESQFLDAVDVLGQLAWPLRKLIKSFYTRPYMIRYLAKCDIDMNEKDGLRHRLSGLGLVGTASY